MREAIEFLEEINPSFKNQDITKINTFGGEFLIYCVQKALEKSNNLEKADMTVFERTVKAHLEDIGWKHQDWENEMHLEYFKDIVKATKLSIFIFHNLRDKKELDNLIDTLEKHNEWRRDENVPPKTKMVSPKELGEAIDKAIEILKHLKS